MRQLIIRDYDDAPTFTDIDLDNLEDILSLYVLVLSGDEVLTVTYKDGSSACYDSSNCRTIGFYDGEYALYNSEVGINKITDEYLKSENSYERMNIVGAEIESNMFRIYTGDKET